MRISGQECSGCISPSSFVSLLPFSGRPASRRPCLPGSTGPPDTCAQGLGSNFILSNALPVAHIEAREVVASIFGVKNVLIDDKSCPSRLRSVADSDLPNGSVFPKDVIPSMKRMKLTNSDEKKTHISSAVIL